MIDYGAGGGTYYYINDHLGTPQQMVDDNGAVVWQAAYLPFGKAQVFIEDVVNNLRFAGQYYDEESGLHYNWNRYYDPETGRYMTADPIGLSGGINLYGYVGGNPVNLVDPMGLFDSPDDIARAFTGMSANDAIGAYWLQDVQSVQQENLLRQKKAKADKFTADWCENQAERYDSISELLESLPPSDVGPDALATAVFQAGADIESTRLNREAKKYRDRYLDNIKTPLRKPQITNEHWISGSR